MPTRFVSPRSAGNPPEGPWPGSHRGGICPQCRAEVRDPQNRHFRDPFHNCRDCGPGAAITTRFPFVRENTSYAGFAMCEACAAENSDPDSRQHGAPSTSCPDCGPQYWIEPAPPPTGGGDLLYEASRLLAAGRILALKDQRAFRLLARADDDALVQRLRRRRGGRTLPAGLMVRDLAMARRVADLDPASERELAAVSSPRVVVPVRDDAPLAPALRARGEVELMLAPEAAYEILFADLDDVDVPLLAIPAQVDREVPVRENEEARRILRDVADHLVLHDLDLFPCTEDWVVRVVDEQAVVLRRSGADTDCPLPLPAGSVQVLALGCESEATAAAALDGCIRLGPFVGELDGERAIDQFGRSALRLLQLFDGRPAYVAFDPHSRHRVADLIESVGATPVAVDHHHAHVAAVMAEHGILGPVVGLSLDGPTSVVHPGLGRAVVLQGTAADSRLFEAFPAFRIPAADLAGRDAWRTSLGMIFDLLGRGVARDWARTQPDAAGSALSMLEHGVDCTRVESLGRTLSGLAAIIGGPAATSPSRLAGPVRDLDPGSLPPAGLPPSALLAGILAEVLRRSREGRPARDTAAWSMTALVRGWALRVAEFAHGAGIDTVVAGGGGLADPWVRHVLARTLADEGLDLYLNRRMPCGDAGIALGQVWSVVCRQG